MGVQRLGAGTCAGKAGALGLWREKKKVAIATMCNELRVHVNFRIFTLLSLRIN